MSIVDHIALARTSCQEALESPPLLHAQTFLAQRGYDEERQREILKTVSRAQKGSAELTSLRDEFLVVNHFRSHPHLLERALILRAAIRSLDSLADLPIDDSVKHLFCREFEFYASPPETGIDHFVMTGYPFVAISMLALLERFPGGQHHWEISGFPRSWLIRVERPSRITLLRFVATHMRGIRPYFVSHAAVSYFRGAFLTPREYFKFFYRMALALERQPDIRGIMGASWLFSAETHKFSPHLKFFNQPFLEAGGMWFDLGAAPAGTDDYGKGDKARADAYRSGQFKPTIGGVICSRAQAIAWKENHPEIAPLLVVN